MRRIWVFPCFHKMGQGIFQLVIIHTQYYSSQKYCAIFAVKVVELIRSISTYTKRKNYNVCKTNTENKCTTTHIAGIQTTLQAWACRATVKVFKDHFILQTRRIFSTSRPHKKSGSKTIWTKCKLYVKFRVYFIVFSHIFSNWLKTFSLTKHCTELNCLELNNSDHVGAAELFCRLEGWTV